MNPCFQSAIDRREFLKSGGRLLVAVCLPTGSSAAVDDRRPTGRALDPAQLDSWLAIAADGSVTAWWGKMDMGQGVDTAIAQIIAEELDVHVDRVAVVFGDSALCVDQGGASGSSGVEVSGLAFRNAAAEARSVLVNLAATKLGCRSVDIVTAGGIASVGGEPKRHASYGMLVGGRMLDAAIDWNGKLGNGLALTGRATPKDPSSYRVVGTSVPRKDISGKVLAATSYLHHLQLPGMLHGRMVRPPVAGARVRSVNQRSVAGIADMRVVARENFVGVVARREWDAIRAARQLQVQWDDSDGGFPTTSDDLFDWIRAAEPAAAKVELNDGDPDAAFANATALLDAEYEWPFQSHARMAPAAAVADVGDGTAVVYTDSQKPFDTARGAALLLSGLEHRSTGVQREWQVRAVWQPGPGSYGRSDAGDGAMDAAVLSASVGAPVRVQWMRHEGHAWDPKGPASVIRCRAAVDGNDVDAYHFHIRGFSRHDQNSRENAPGEVLAGHLLGFDSTPEWSMNQPADSYRFAAKRYSWEALPPLRRNASPLRTSHFRDPYGPEVHFASESFIDEMAYATGCDPLEFRLRHISDDRDAAVLRAAAELADWTPRNAARRSVDADGNLTGTGIAYAQRGGSVNAVIAEVVVTPGSGRIRVRRFWVGADHGLVVNPFTLERTIEGNLLQATSRTLFEEVRFDRNAVLSVDWQTYPILEARDAPDEINIRHVNRPDLGPRGAGEPTTRVTPAAIANAVFDATGVRLRRVPFTPERVRVALADQASRHS